MDPTQDPSLSGQGVMPSSQDAQAALQNPQTAAMLQALLQNTQQATATPGVDPNSQLASLGNQPMPSMLGAPPAQIAPQGGGMLNVAPPTAGY